MSNSPGRPSWTTMATEVLRSQAAEWGGRGKRWQRVAGPDEQGRILTDVEYDERAPSVQRPPDDASERARLDELVDEQGRDSFPASDPPSTWAGEDQA
jgi:hypothetical protein